MSTAARTGLFRLVLAAGVVALILWVLHPIYGSPSGHTVRLVMRDSNGLRVHSDVKIGGVPGGTVSGLDLGKGDVAIVTVKLKDNAWPIGQDATAMVRPVNLLGEKYVDLRPGTMSHPLPDGGTIPLQRTGTSVELDDVLNTLDPSTRGALRILINEFGIGVAGRGADFNSLLEHLPPALDQTRRLVAGFAADTATLRRLVVEGDRVIAAFHEHRADLQDLVSQASRTLAVVASRRRELGATLQNAPGALASLRSTLTNLGASARALGPAAQRLQASAPSLASTLHTLPGFARAAAPTLAAARRDAAVLQRLGHQGSPVIRRLRPTADKLARFADGFAGTTKTLNDSIHNALGFMEGWDRSIQSRDGLGHVFLTQPFFDEDLIRNAVNRYGQLTREPAARGRSGHRPATAPDKVAAPALPAQASTPGGATAQPTPLKQPVDSAVGDVNKILTYLLGG